MRPSPRRSIPMISETDLQGVVGRIYDTALDPGSWTKVMNEIATIMGAAASVAYYTSADRDEIPLLVHHGIDGEALREFGEYYLNIDPRVSYITHHPQEVVCDYMHHSESEMARNEYYDWLTHKYDLKYYIGGALPAVEGLTGYCSVNRTPGQGHASAADLRLFGLLKQHMGRAMQISIKTHLIELRTATARDALNQLQQGVVVVDGQARIKWMNAFARRLVEDGDGLRAPGLCLETTFRADSARLAAAIKSAVDAGRAIAEPPGAAVVVRRRSGAAPLLLLVTPAPRGSPLLETKNAAAIVFVTDPELSADQPARHLQAFYGLTEREADLAIALAKGLSPAEYARDSELAINTVRWHVKQIQSKTNAARQSDIVRLVMATPRVTCAVE